MKHWHVANHVIKAPCKLNMRLHLIVASTRDKSLDSQKGLHLVTGAALHGMLE